ncbi:hypothetical protein MLD38_005007 [Melastoma candidum]|uniref:Uncharacterized protein n=1 Tax=Melastoma candidum TaxID=119954 RepID=A0ACB9SG48_9MYRT|nr:hypothetical protein MLD38_005007 [Melastoma candidum]
MKSWCSHCAKFVIAERPFDGSLCCTDCGRVLEYFNFSVEPTFMKDGAGQSYLSGNFIRTVQSDSASRERTLEKASEGMKNICYGLGMDEPHGIVKAASAFYRMALEKNFTRGRRAEHVEAACIYIACRESKLPYLLIDFANSLKINIYVLGAVFLQLCKVLWLEEHHILQKPIDPSLFIHKYTTSLAGGRNNEIARTALRIIASMRRDWMQTGRKPSGLWGAAVYVSALAHGIKCSKSDILRLVHICEATLTKRLVEFESTESGSLTIDELNAKARLDERTPAKHPNIGLNLSSSRELLCEHKGSGVPHFAIGLCESCYNEFVEFSGGLEGGSDPPAFQRAELERMSNSSGREREGDPCSKGEKHNSTPEDHDVNSLITRTCEAGYTGDMGFEGPGKADDVDGKAGDGDTGSFEGSGKADGVDGKAGEESDTFSDIDDVEVDDYLHNEQETLYKTMIWEEVNREYIQEQAAKEAAAAAAREAQAANFKGGSQDLQAAQELAASTAAALAKSRKERQQKRAAELKNAAPPQTAAEATRQMLVKKRLSSKINYDVLETLFDEPVIPDKSKKLRTEINPENDEKVSHRTGGKPEIEEEQNEDGTTRSDGDYDDGKVTYGDDTHDENVYESYDYDDGSYDYDGF